MFTVCTLLFRIYEELKQKHATTHIVASIKQMCPDIFLGKTLRGSFPVNEYLPRVVAFWVVAYGRFDMLVACKGQLVKRSKLRTRLGRALVCYGLKRFWLSLFEIVVPLWFVAHCYELFNVLYWVACG